MNARATLEAMPLLRDVGDDGREALLAVARPIALRSGEILYRKGDAAGDLYLVLAGRLRVSAGERLIGYVGRLEPLGEMGVISGEAHSATVQAVRDSAVLAVAADAFLAVMQAHPAGLLALSRLAIDRLRQQQRTRMLAATERHGTFAVIPATPDVPTREFAVALVRRLGGWPDARLIGSAHVDAALGPGTAAAPLDDDEAGAVLVGWLGEREARHRYVVLAAGSEDSDAWAMRCLHNADRVLVLAESGVAPTAVPALAELRRGGAAVELVLLRPEGEPSPYTLEWRERTGARAHYFLHPWDELELGALARQVSGRGVGLVLGGGGARGFAHIGLVAALEQLDVPVDIAGGTSMGAFVAALVASGYDSSEMTQIARDTFVRANYLNDYAVPRVSLIRGRRFAARLRDIFGDRQVEDLRRTYFSVSANLTTGVSVVHDRGPLAAWVGTSMAVPGVAPPIAWEGDLLCDGGVLDNLPTDVMARFERGAIVASNVSGEGAIAAPGAGHVEPDPEALLHRRGDDVPRLSEILMRSATLNGPGTMARAAERADVYMRMPSQDYGMFDWKAIDDLIALGYEHAMAVLEPVVGQLREGVSVAASAA